MLYICDWQVFFFCLFLNVKIMFMQLVCDYSTFPWKTWFGGLTLCQRCPNPKHQVTVVTKFCTVLPNVCGSSAWDLLCAVCSVPSVLKWSQYSWKIRAPAHQADYSNRLFKNAFLSTSCIFVFHQNCGSEDGNNFNASRAASVL